MVATWEGPTPRRRYGLDREALVPGDRHEEGTRGRIRTSDDDPVLETGALAAELRARVCLNTSGRQPRQDSNLQWQAAPTGLEPAPNDLEGRHSSD